MLDSIVNIWLSLYDFIYDFWMTCINILSYIASILWFIWYGWKTLLIWLFKILWNIFDWWVFVNVNRAFIFISDYIWWPVTIIFVSLLFIIIIRIIIAFVFKLLRLNIDYHSLNSKSKRWSQSDSFEKYH